MPTFNKIDMMNCARGHHDFSDDATECHVCGCSDDEAGWPASPAPANSIEAKIQERASLAATYAGDGALYSAARILIDLTKEILDAAESKTAALDKLISGEGEKS